MTVVIMDWTRLRAEGYAIGHLLDEATPFYRVGVAFQSGSTTWVNSGGFPERASWRREMAAAGDDPSPGGAQIVLGNEDGRFGPDNPDSPYAGMLLPRRDVELDVTYSGSTHPLFRGRIESLKLDPELGKRTIAIECTDRVARLKDAMLDMPVRAEINVGTLFSEVLSHAGFPSDQVSVDTFSETVPFAYFSDDRATDAIGELLEIGDYKAFCARDGIFHVKDRYYDILGDSVGSYENLFGMSYEFDGQDVRNHIQIRSRPRKRKTTVDSIGHLGEVIEIPGGDSFGFEVDFVDPDDPNESRTPAQSVTVRTYAAATQSGGGGVDLTAQVSLQLTTYAKSAVCTATNVDSRTAYLNAFALQGYSLQKLPEVNYFTEDSSSQAVYGTNKLTLGSDYLEDLSYARDYSAYLLEDTREAVGKVGLRLKNVFPAIFTHELGDLVTVIESHTGANSAYTIIGVEHTLDFQKGREHTLRLDLEFYRDRRWKIFDHDVRGRLDHNRLAL